MAPEPLSLKLQAASWSVVQIAFATAVGARAPRPLLLRIGSDIGASLCNFLVILGREKVIETSCCFALYLCAFVGCMPVGGSALISGPNLYCFSGSSGKARESRRRGTARLRGVQ